MAVGWLDVHGMEFPRRPDFTINSAVNGASGLIDATGEKLAAMGRVWHRYSGAKLIDKVWWRFGTIVKGGGSALVTSLQDVNLAAGPPQQPDGTQDQTVAMANAGLATGMYQTGSLSAQRSVNRGDLLSAVLEFDGAGRLGSDSFIVQALVFSGSPNRTLDTTMALFSSAAWANLGTVPHGLLEFSDGTFGTWAGTWPHNSMAATAFNTGSAADERGLKIDVPVPMKIMGASVALQLASGADCDLVLYDASNNVLASSSLDASAIEAVTQPRRVDFLFAADVLLEPGQSYRLVLKPTTANSITVWDFLQSSAAHWQAWPGPTSWQLTTRADAGAWTDLATTRIPMALLVSQMLVSPAQLINSEGLVG